MTAIWPDAILARATDAFDIRACYYASNRAIPGASLYAIHVPAPVAKPVHISPAA